MTQTTLSKWALAACVISSLCVFSCSWTTIGSVRRAPSSRISSSSTSTIRRATSDEDVVQEGTAKPTAAAAAEPEEPPRFEPWWEEERRTEGKPTLSRSTQWRMFLTLKDPTLGGEAGESTEVAVRVRFDEDKDFEPPQGSLEVIEDNPCFTQQAGKARWTLSEAEDTRGAGLWVWGLFKDPLYPFLLLQMNNLEIPLKGGAKIAPGRLYVKVDHRRDDELGPTLKSGTVGVKLIERVRVDPLGMAEADIASVVPCGSVRFRPV
ncbi:unnamed protein product [Scytosiphon promiscuus]